MEHTVTTLLVWSISNIVFSVLVIRFFIRMANERIRIVRIRDGLYKFILDWDRYHNGTKIEIEKVLKFKLLENGK